MKKPRTIHPSAPILFAAALVACTSADTNETTKAPTAEDVAQQAEKAATTTAAYAENQWQEYRTNMRAQLQAIDHRIDTMQDQVATRSSEWSSQAKSQWQETMTELRGDAKKLSQQLEKSVDRGQDAMGDLQRGIDKAWAELQASVQQAEGELKSETAESSADDRG